MGSVHQRSVLLAEQFMDLLLELRCSGARVALIGTGNIRDAQKTPSGNPKRLMHFRECSPLTQLNENRSIVEAIKANSVPSWQTFVHGRELGSFKDQRWPLVSALETQRTSFRSVTGSDNIFTS
eukprot:1522071-Amphidinium_carterae.1